ncbi:MAG: hypothetical protein Q8R91_10675, partial [Candidatus Omnitrophota bacterium]|nr:hypothetical protein [Candidatus Omnitrophota bacterium]
MSCTIGRDEELKTLLANARRGIPTLLLGKSGLGKTHLLQQLIAHLARRGVKAVSLDRLWPFKPALLALRAALTRTDEQALNRLKRLTVPELAQETLSG